MAVPKELRGPWVQVAHQLRYTRDTPPRQDEVSARPRKGGRGDWGAFEDDPDAAYPGCTLVTFPADAAVDVPALLRQGALREPRADQLPKRTRTPNKPQAKGASDGEASR